MQFGTSRFLQAHADLFVSEAGGRAQITIVQTTGAAGRAGRLAAFSAPEGFPVIVRGREKGAVVDREVRVVSVARGLSALDDWAELVRIVTDEARWIVSNTSDAGFAVPEDERLDLTVTPEAAPGSFIAKLLALLAARHRAGQPGLTLLPCELVARNGDRLRELVLGLAHRSGAAASLVRWLEDECLWVSSLVDRIVSAPLEPAGAVAEPYALWAIEDQPGFVPPCKHEAIRVVADLEPYERLKLHILNLGHTLLAERWLQAGATPGVTVREMLADAGIRGWLETIYREEVLPGFARHGLAREADAYVATTLERFENPFLDHLVSDIAQNHVSKVARRIGDFLAWCNTGKSAGKGERSPLNQPRLSALVAARAAA